MRDAMTDMRNNKKLRDAIESLHQQLASRDAEVAELNLVSITDTGTESAVAKLQDERDPLFQQLAAALAACKLKDGALVSALRYYERMFGVCLDSKYIAHNQTAIDNFGPAGLASIALAIQPDDSALKAWLGKQSSRVKE